MKKIFIFCLVAAALVAIFLVTTAPSDPVTLPAVYNSDLDGSVSQVKSYLKHNLADPDSYEAIEWSPVVSDTGAAATYRYAVRHKYRAKNSYGGYEVRDDIFFLDSTGGVLSYGPNR
jgi:hypothetical protein